MKKAIAISILTMFILSLVPSAFADEDGEIINVNSETDAGAEIQTSNSGSNSGSETNIQDKTKVRIDVKDNIKKREDMREKKQIMERNLEKLRKLQALDQRQIEKLSELKAKHIEKITQLKKERLEKLAKLNKEKIERLTELDEDDLERVTGLNETEISKLGSLNRARLHTLANMDENKIRSELMAFNIVKVKHFNELNKKNISDEELNDLRERFEHAQEKFKEARDDLKDIREEIKDARKAGNEQETLNHSKEFLLKASDVLINHLEKIKAKVQENANIGNETEARIVAEIDAQIAEINRIKADIHAATTKEEIKAAAKELREKWNKIKNLIRLHTERIVAARVEGIVNFGLVIEKRLDKILDKLDNSSIEVNVTTEVNAFSEKIATSRDKYKQAQSKFNEILDLRTNGEPADSDKIKKLLDEANDLLKQAREALREAHEILKTIVKKIKEAAPHADLSADVEIEVAQDVSDDHHEVEVENKTEVEANAST